MSRAFLALLAGLLIAAPVARADLAGDLRARTAFTLAGGGSARPADGLPAGDAKLFVYGLAALPDGRHVAWLR